MGTVRQNTFGDIIALNRDTHLTTSGMILMVGEPQLMQTLKKHFPERSGVFFIEFSDLSQDILSAICPDSVVAPAISAHFDCLELAAFLNAADFKGLFRAIAKDLPRPEIIRNEVRHHFPRLNFDVISPARAAPRDTKVMH